MKRILCYGDSNTWGSRPAGGRHPWEERWPGVLAGELGEGWRVVEEGLPGRTTARPDPVEGADRDGSSYLRPCLESHWPLDWVVIVLGTNDCKHRFQASAEEIAAGAGVLIDIVRSYSGEGREPQILLVAPAPFGRLSGMAALFAGGTQRSRGLGPAFQAAAEAREVHFLDAGTLFTTPDNDGIHLNAAEQRALGEGVARVIRQSSTA